ncbi:MAG: hypothetical protein M3R50_08200 [Bacteroidota bacterium]|nr:hypothetical protein [Bacteroidota bacterium]
MSHLKLLSAIIFSSCLLYACSGNSSTNAGNLSASLSENTSANSSGDASFSYKIDGKTYSGKGTDNTVNCIYKKPNNIIQFILMTIDPTEKWPPQFAFGVADKGSTTIRQDDMNKLSAGSDVKYFANISFQPQDNSTPHFEFNPPITVNLTSVSASKVSGTFSGTLIDPDTKKVVQLTEGVFDLPYSTRK